MSVLERKIEGLSPRRRELLEKLLKQSGLAASLDPAGEPPLRRVDRSARFFPLSSAQERLWFLEQLGDTRSTFTVHLTYRLKRRFDPDVLGKAVRALVERHEALRTGFVRLNGEPRQFVAEAQGCYVAHDLSGIESADERARVVRNYLEQERNRQFDLESGRPLAVVFLTVSDSEQLLLFTLHHLVSDAWSHQQLARELLTLYFSFEAGGDETCLAPLPLQYIDYASWQRGRLRSLDRQLAYWKTELAGSDFFLELPADFVRPDQLDYRGGAVRFQIPSERLARMKARARQLGCSVFMYCLCAYCVLLAKYCGGRDFVVGTDVASRTRLDVKDVVGFFVNQLALRCRWSGDPTLAALVAEVRRTCLRAYEHQDVPFNVLVDQLKVPRSTGHTPVFQTKLTFDNAGGEVRAGETLEILGQETDTAEVDLEVSMREVEGDLQGQFRYRTTLFSKRTIESMREDFLAVLDVIAEQPQKRLSQIELSSAHNSTLHGPLKAVEPSLVDRLLDAPDPTATAVEFEGRCWTYAELRENVEALAAGLLEQGVGPGEIVAVGLPRGPELLMTHLAVMRVGACYVPLDVEQGLQRIRFLLEDSGARHIVTTAAMSALLPECSARAIVLEGDWRTKLAAPVPEHWPGSCDSQLAYILYTSGSGGKPKGVAVGLKSLSNFLGAMLPVTAMTSSDRLLAVTTTTFDISGLELYLPLLAKATVVIASRSEAQDSRVLWDKIGTDRISVLQATPATWRGLCAIAKGRQLPELRGLCGGEALPADLAATLSGLCKSVHNLYGPTETTIWSSSEKIDGPLEAGASVAPLGSPILNTTLCVLDPDGSRRPAGAAGELCIAGEGLAIGYWGRPALTAASFIPDAWSGRPGGRLYLTGDVAKVSQPGKVQFLGRRDHQVKVRGYRVELGEIESVLCGHPKVSSAAAITVPDGNGEVVLHAFVTLKGEGGRDELLIRELGEHASLHLPSYMVPSTLSWMDVLPLTASGKIDRALLRQRALEVKAHVRAEGTLPGTEGERRVAAIWRDVLGLQEAYLEQDFFESGGHSLTAVKLLDRIETESGRRVSLQQFFLDPTLAGLVKSLPESVAGERGARIVADESSRYEPFELTEMQEAYLLGRRSDLVLGSIATQSYLERDVEDLDVARFTDCWNALIERHDMLRAVFDRSGRQRVLPEVARYEVECEDLSSAKPEDKAAYLKTIRQTMSSTSLPADTGPLFSLRLSRLTERTYRIHFCLDMLIADALSTMILLGELHELYMGRGHLLPKLDLTFRDCVLAERNLKSSAEYEKARAYWLQRLDRFPSGPELPLARNPGQLTGQRFVSRRRVLDGETWSAIQRHAGRHGVSPTVTLLTAFSQVLATWSRSKHFALNLTMFNRRARHEQVNQIVGDFTSSLLLEVLLDSRRPFSHQAHDLESRLWQDMDNAHFTGVSVLRELNRRSGGSTPASMPVVFTSTLGLEQARAAPQDAAPSVEERQAGEEAFGISQTSQVWIDHQVSEVSGRLHMAWDAVDDLFPPGLLDAMFEAYWRLLTSLAGEQGWVTNLSLVPAGQLAAREQVNSRRASIDETLLHELFERSVDRHAHREAIVTEARRITYGQAEAWANSLAQIIRARNGEQLPVAIVMDKGWEQVIAALAVMKAGAAYLPVDASLPAKRVESLICDGRCRLVLARPGLFVPDPAREYEVVEVCEASLAGTPAERVVQPRSCTEVAYIIYTSGSTGEPKGVVIDHRGAVNTILDINRRFDITSEDSVLAVSSLSFDLSVYDIFGILAAGGTVVMPAGDQATEVGTWRRLVERERITVWNSVPALMQLLVEHCEALGSRSLASLKVVMLSGDWIPVELPGRVRALAPRSRVISLGGATEASIWSIFHPVDEVAVSRLPSVPYGTPLTNQSFQVLDCHMQPCPDWVPGDLYIGGIGVAKGYWQKEQLTAASFIHTGKFGLLYRTGDLGRYTQNGVIEFLGRQDNQVKIQGYRVELGEIEAALQEHPGVKSALVTAAGSGREGKRLVAYVVPQPASVRDGATPGVTSAIDRSLFKLEQRSVRRLSPELPRLPIGTPATQSIFESAEAAGTAGQPLNVEMLARAFGGLRQVPLALAPLPKYFYPSASSLYPVQLYLNIGGSHIPGVEPGFFYYSSAENALIRLSGPASTSQQGVQIVWVADLDAITPMYPRELALRFVHLEAGHMKAVIESAARELSLAHSCHWMEDPAVDRTLLPKEAYVLGYSILGHTTSPSTTSPAGERLEYDVLKRQSFREFSDRRVAVSSLCSVLGVLAANLPPAVELLVYAKPARCEADTEGWFQFDASSGSLAQIGKENPDRVAALYGEDNRAVFERAALAVFLVARGSESAKQSELELIQAGCGSQRLLAYSWSVGLGFCPIGALDEAGLGRLLRSKEPLRLLQSFVGGAIEEGQLRSWNASSSSTKGSSHGAELERFLHARLPAYMVPKVYIPLEALPLTSNGKVDRKALPAPQLDTPVRAQAVAPRNAVESKLLALWKDELGVEAIGVQDNFFTAGGNSLMAMRISSRLESEHELALSLRSFFEMPTVEQLAEGVVDLRGKRSTGEPDVYAYAGSGRQKPVSLPLTPGQRQIFAHCQLHDGSAYNITSAFRIDGELQADVVRDAWERVLSRHDSLRMGYAYVDGDVAQLVHERAAASFKVIHLEHLDESAAAREVERLIELEAGAQLDLLEGPLVTCKLLRLSAARHVVVLNVHHILADHLSMDVVANELAQLCTDAKDGRLPELPLQFSDFVLWQQQFLQSERASRQVEYWKTTLSGLPRQVLPDEPSDTGSAGSAGKWEEWRVGADVFQALKQRCADMDVSLFILILAAIQQLLSVETGQQDIAVATPVSTRHNPDLEKIVGLMLNTLILRINMPEETRKSEFIAGVKRIVMDAFDNREVPVELIQKALGATVGHRLYGVRYVYRRIHSRSRERDPAARVTWLEVPRKDAKFDMLVSFNEFDDGLVGDIEYRADLWREPTISRMKSGILCILRWLAASDDESLGALRTQLAGVRQGSRATGSPVSADAADGLAGKRFRVEEIGSGEHTLPVIRPADRRYDIVQCIRENAGELRALIHSRGGVLFRGFRVSGASHLERLIREGFDSTPLSYENRSTPRAAVTGRIYTSTEYPASQNIPLHNENSYTRSWPGKIFFYCVKPSAAGGETPIADSRRVLSRLPEELVQRFDRDGVLYVRNYRDLDLSWKEVFQAERREDVERYCGENEIGYEWLGADHLRTRQICQALARHPVTGEKVWFNQAHLFHVSALPADVRAALQSSIAAADLPRNAFLGDGSEIDRDDLAAIRNAYEAEQLVFTWQAGDVLCLDNLLMAHGRLPFQGARKVLVGMAEPFVGMQVTQVFGS